MSEEESKNKESPSGNSVSQLISTSSTTKSILHGCTSQSTSVTNSQCGRDLENSEISVATCMQPVRAKMTAGRPHKRRNFNFNNERRAPMEGEHVNQQFEEVPGPSHYDFSGNQGQIPALSVSPTRAAKEAWVESLYLIKIHTNSQKIRDHRRKLERRRRAAESPAEHVQRLVVMRQRASQRRNQETEYQRNQRLEGMRQRALQIRNQETEEQRNQRLQAMRQRASERRKQETEQQRNRRLQIERQRAAQKRSQESEQQRIQRLQAMRQRAWQRRNQETEHQRKQRLQVIQQAESQCRAKNTGELMIERLKSILRHTLQRQTNENDENPAQELEEQYRLDARYQRALQQNWLQTYKEELQLPESSFLNQEMKEQSEREQEENILCVKNEIMTDEEKEENTMEEMETKDWEILLQSEKQRYTNEETLMPPHVVYIKEEIEADNIEEEETLIPPDDVYIKEEIEADNIEEEDPFASNDAASVSNSFSTNEGEGSSHGYNIAQFQTEARIIPVSKTQLEEGSGEGVFPCCVCKARFLTRDFLLSHLRKHKGKTYQCNICQRKLSSHHQSLKKHMKQHLRTQAGEDSLHTELPCSASSSV